MSEVGKWQQRSGGSGRALQILFQTKHPARMPLNLVENYLRFQIFSLTNETNLIQGESRHGHHTLGVKEFLGGG